MLAWLLHNGSLTRWTFIGMVALTFFLASAGASAAYLTVSEIFPMEARALAIAFFYAVGTAIGGITGPLLFGHLIESGKVDRLAFGFVLGSVVMAVGGIAEIFLGVDAEGKALEDIATPMSVDDEGEGEGEGESEGGEDRAPAQARRPGAPAGAEEPEAAATGARPGGARRRPAGAHGPRRLGPSSIFYSPRMAMAASDPGPGDLTREVERIERALDEHGATARAELARLVGARRWGPGRFAAALRQAIADGRVERRGRGSFAAPDRR